MDRFELELVMQALYIAAQFYEHDRFDTLLDLMGNDFCISFENSIAFTENAFLAVFQDSRYFYHNGKSVPPEYEGDRYVFVLRDPLVTRYDNLCRQYERETGITKVENSFASTLESTVQQAMQLSSYCYDYRWCDGTRDRKGPKIVLITDEEFDVFYDIPKGLFHILDFCAEGIPKLEAALAEAHKQKLVPWPVKDLQKEAA